jgi:hypothetical protein
LVFIGRSLQFGFLNTRLLHCRAPEPIAAAAIDLVRGPYNLDLPFIRTRFPRPASSSFDDVDMGWLPPPAHSHSQAGAAAHPVSHFLKQLSLVGSVPNGHDGRIDYDTVAAMHA